jgi:hypothetical protein
MPRVRKRVCQQSGTGRALRVPNLIANGATFSDCIFAYAEMHEKTPI